MTNSDLQALKAWFDIYTKLYYSSNGEDQRNIMLKVEHTRHVCRNIVEIAQGSHLDENQIRVAEAIALFHDIGRFPQYARYRTFRDAESVSHGRLGAQTLVKENILNNLPDNEEKVIIQAVRFHGAFAIPTVLDEETVFFLKLIRDADKVDIFRVFIEYYESPEDQRASATAFGVPDIPEYSEIMLTSLLKKEVAAYSDIKTENDFKLMKLSWIYDMHFNESIRLLEKSNLIDALIDKLPHTDEIRSAAACLKEYIYERLHNE
jgi:HD superfamily phosphohydrolase YqeK